MWSVGIFCGGVFGEVIKVELLKVILLFEFIYVVMNVNIDEFLFMYDLGDEEVEYWDS